MGQDPAPSHDKTKQWWGSDQIKVAAGEITPHLSKDPSPWQGKTKQCLGDPDQGKGTVRLVGSHFTQAKILLFCKVRKSRLGDQDLGKGTAGRIIPHPSQDTFPAQGDTKYCWGS